MSSSHIFAELCLNLLAADEQHESHAVWSHRRRYTLRLSCEVIRPDQHDEERSAIPMAGSSSADVLTPVSLETRDNQRISQCLVKKITGRFSIDSA